MDHDLLAKMVMESVPKDAPPRIPDEVGTLRRNAHGEESIFATAKCGCEAEVVGTDVMGLPILGWIGCDVHVYDENGELTIQARH